jgi:hypothetical protein
MTTRPSNTILPEVGGISQVSILKNVDLPAPFWADDAAQFTAMNRKIDISVGEQAAVALGQTARL